MYSISDIEDAIIDALEPLKSLLAIRTIKSYQEELADEDTIARSTRLLPAILVVYRGSSYVSHGARKIEQMTFVIFAVDRNLRSEADARRGADNPGTYAILRGVRDILYGSRLGLDIFPLSLMREQAEYFGTGISVYSAEYETAQALLYEAD